MVQNKTRLRLSSLSTNIPQSEELMQTFEIDISELSADPANARKHDERNLEAIKASLRRFGQQKPIVVDSSNVVRAGNGTLAAAQSLGWETITVVQTDLQGSEATAYAIADNRTAELAEWNDDVLAASLASLNDQDESLLSDLAFSEQELEMLINSVDGPSEVVEDEVPEPPEDPITQPGDLWLLGDHRLLCGDSTKAEDVTRLMNGRKADLWLTDPPYNLAYTGKTQDALKIDNDSMHDADFRSFLVQCFQIAFDNLKPGGSYYIWHADTEGLNFRGAINDCGETLRQCLVWQKNVMVMGGQDYHWQHEPCLYGWKKGASHGWYNDRKQTTLLVFDRPSRSTEHPTMKPVGLFRYQIGNSTAPQGLVFDSFLGSGTTLIACHELGRTCYGLELSPSYCDVIIARWEAATGKKATKA
jgi:site-specific DNA-methyltransferase (adenine-specific)